MKKNLKQLVMVAMCIIGVACMFLKPKTENQNIKKIKRVAPKKGW